jgi:hypothetical protein
MLLKNVRTCWGEGTRRKFYEKEKGKFSYESVIIVQKILLFKGLLLKGQSSYLK